MDEEARSQFANEMADFYRAHPGGNYYTDVLMAEFIQVARSSQNPANISPWNLHSLPGSTLNVAMFASGLGDGCFESFWAISPDGDVTALVTDFGLL